MQLKYEVHTLVTLGVQHMCLPEGDQQVPLKIFHISLMMEG